MTISLLKPMFLLLALAIPFLWWRAKSLAMSQKLIRSLVFAFLILALANPVVKTREPREHLIVILDQSDSLPQESLVHGGDRLRTILAQAKGTTKKTIIVLGGRFSDAALADEVIYLKDKESDLGAALDIAAFKLQADVAGSVLVISDGESTKANWGDAVLELSQRHIPVHCIELKSRQGDLYPSSLQFSAELRVGQPCAGFVEVVGARGGVELTIAEEGKIVETLKDQVPDAQGRIHFVVEPKEAGFRKFTVSLVGDDDVDGNNSLSQLVAVNDPKKVLYLGSRVLGGAQALGKLVGPGFEVSAPGSQGAVSFADFDLVVVDDLPAARFTEAQQERLLEAARTAGTGILVSGGPASFGPGGYQSSPLADVLPVRFLQKEEKKDPSTSLVIIIDTSGSMGRTRVQLAKEVARLAMRRLLPHDKVGIVEFYGAKRWAAPLQPASNAIEIQRALNRLQAGGGTVIMPAIEEAYYGLQNVNTRYKHVLVLTDGGVESGAFEPLIRKMAERGVNTSTVLLGPRAHNDFLVNLSQWGKGRFYAVPNRFNLPEILLKQPTSSRLPAYRQGSFAVKADGRTYWWGDIDPESVPPVSGFVELKLRPGAEAPLRVAQGESPLVATWMTGCSRVTILSTEPLGPGTASWRDWTGYGQFLAHLFSRTARPNRNAVTYKLARDGNRVTVTAKQTLSDGAAPKARYLGEGSWKPLVFQKRAPGIRVAELAWKNSDEFRVITESSHRLLLAKGEKDDVELQVNPAEGLDLALLASDCGGQFESTAAAPISLTYSDAQGPWGLRFLAPWCFLLALLTYIFDVFNRRRDRLLR